MHVCKNVNLSTNTNRLSSRSGPPGPPYRNSASSKRNGSSPLQSDAQTPVNQPQGIPTLSQKCKTSSTHTHRQRSPNDLHPGRIRRRRPHQILGNNTPLHDAHARPIRSISLRHGCIPAWNRSFSPDRVKICVGTGLVPLAV